MNLQQLRSIADGATPGPWMLATSNSWRRFVTAHNTRPVCEPIVYSRTDPHPDLHFANGGANGPDARFMETFHPLRIKKLLDCVEALEALHADPVSLAPRYAARAALQALEGE